MRRRADRSAGFSLLEMMVALTAGSIAVSAAYFIGSASTRHFYQQSRVAQGQISLRSAVEQIRRDIQRAGYGMPANSMGAQGSLFGRTCLNPARHVQAVEFVNNNNNIAIPNFAAHAAANIGNDRLRLTGNFLTGEMYLAGSIGGGGTTVPIQSSWPGFQRNFVDPTTLAILPAAFLNVFSPPSPTSRGRMVYIQFLGTGLGHLAEVAPGTGVVGAVAQVVLNPAVPLNGRCATGLGTGSLVVPLSRLEYTIIQPAAASALANAAGTASVLVRREVDFTGAATPMGNAQILVENAVNFNLDFIYQTAASIGTATPVLSYMTGDQVGQGAFPALNDVNSTPGAQPELIRSIVVNVSVRMPQEDPNLPWVAPALGEELTRFQVTPNSARAAQVRTVSFEVAVPNLIPISQ